MEIRPAPHVASCVALGPNKNMFFPNFVSHHVRTLRVFCSVLHLLMEKKITSAILELPDMEKSCPAWKEASGCLLFGPPILQVNVSVHDLSIVPNIEQSCCFWKESTCMLFFSVFLGSAASLTKYCTIYDAARPAGLSLFWFLPILEKCVIAVAKLWKIKSDFLHL
jgi:energy-converting hydrogenase Eha subunit A